MHSEGNFSYKDSEEVRQAGAIRLIEHFIYIPFTCRPRFINPESANQVITYSPACVPLKETIN